MFIRLPDADMRNLDRMSRELEGIKTVADSMMSAGGGHALAGMVGLGKGRAFLR